ncbi:MAG: UDP-N-acetylglucosamine 2-epimerase (non-hydrolyzing) [Myxococcota bacterium]|jgi:UDP-N-acetylglucosamine 2-epimerase (non-hydrolysing)
MKKLLFIFGTRPEAIKMAPLVKEFRKDPALWDVKVCVTAQHREMLDQVLGFFEITPDYDLDLMKPNQSLFQVTAGAISGLEKVLDGSTPDIIFVQGDTTTAFVGALAGFYKKIRVAHIEAGLRSGDRYSPFPEEINRILAGHISDWHFAPTKGAAANLAREGITANVHVVGNTVVDALFLGLDLIRSRGDSEYEEFYRFANFDRRVILVTGHRRESFGGPFRDICTALRGLADRFDDVEIIYPVHLNPNVRAPVFELLKGHSRIHLIEPVGYPYLIWLMNRCHLVLTDSGGIQEEAPSLAKPVLVMRNVTERMEGVEAGTAMLVGTDHGKIIAEASTLLSDSGAYNRMAKAVNPYGDGHTSQRVASILAKS